MDQAKANQILSRMEALRKGKIMSAGAQGVEAHYAGLYQQLVRGGHAPQIKRKHRTI